MSYDQGSPTKEAAQGTRLMVGRVSFFEQERERGHVRSLTRNIFGATPPRRPDEWSPDTRRESV